MAPDFCSDQSYDSQISDHYPPPRITKDDICAKLVATDKVAGRKEVILLSIAKPVTVGRNPALCSYVILDGTVSGLHCKLYAVEAGTGGVIVSCQDVSANGVILNGHRIRRTSVILMDGDLLEIIPSKIFRCVHLIHAPLQKHSPFDSTPTTEISSVAIGRFQVTSHTLGCGSFATVHLAIDTRAHRQVACKVLTLRNIRNKHDMEQIKKEIDILAALDHPNINHVFEVKKRGSFLYIFLEICTGSDLFAFITYNSETYKGLCEAEAKYIMYQLLRGLKYMHDRHVSHRDLKPENILVRFPGRYPHIQIGDFGLARPQAYERTLNVVGTPSYLPPEGIRAMDNKELGYVGMPADCWSIGVILYFMLSGAHPFDFDCPSAASHCCLLDGCNSSGCHKRYSEMTPQGRNDIDTKRRILHGRPRYSPYVWDDLGDAKSLVEVLLIYDPVQRAKVGMALESEWISKDREDLEAVYLDRVQLR